MKTLVFKTQSKSQSFKFFPLGVTQFGKHIRFKPILYIMCTSLYQVINKSLISIVFTIWWGMRIRRIHKCTRQSRNSITRIGTNIIKYTYLENTSSCRDPLLDLGSLMHSLLMNSKDHHILQNPLNFLHSRSH